AIENARLFEANAGRERRLTAARQISMASLENRDTAVVLGMVAARAREFTGSDLAVVATVVEGGTALVVGVAHGAGGESLEGTKLPMEGSLAGSVATSARSLVVDDLGADDGAFRSAIAGALPTPGPAAFVPMAAGGRVFGTLIAIRHAPARRYSAQDAAAVESLAAQAAVALEYGRSQDQLRRLAVLEDRERIARDLHDGAIQSLFAVGMNLQATAMRAEGREVASRIGMAVSELDRVILELRNYIFGLRAELSGEQLEEALRGLAADFQERSGVLTVVTIDREVAMRLQRKAGDLVQLTREALSNVSRHARATTCRVSLVRLDGGEALLEIDDDGQGFDPSQPVGGMGLRHVRERVEKLGWGVELKSEPDSGTCVRVNVPL
ncbi:MAG: GAF domain-containing protein, partial [Actinomycetota bacterium]